jgi:maltose O-acetyltransferase
MPRSRLRQLRGRLPVLDSLVHRIRGTRDVPSLVRRGLELGDDVFIADDVYIDAAWAWLVSIGAHSTLAPRVVILAHDAATKRELGYSVVRRVRIGNGVFIGAGAIILPGVTIGDEAIVGAGAVVRRDVAPGSLVIGNPAEHVCAAADYLQKHRTALEAAGVRGLTSDDRAQIIATIGTGAMYVD